MMLSRVRGRRRRGSRVLVRVARMTAVILVVIECTFPLYWVLVNALQPGSSRFAWPPEIFPSAPTLDAFRTVFTETGIVKWLLNTTIVASGTTVVTLAFGVWAAYAFSRFRSRGITVVSLLTLATQMIPLVIIMPPLFRVFLTGGLNNNLAALVLANFIFVLPVVTWMLKSIFDGIPIEYEEAARADGANRLQVMMKVTGPLALPGVAAAAAFAFIEAWQEFLFARLLIRDPELFVGTIGIGSFFGFRATPWSSVMAAAFLFSIPPVILFLFVQRYLVAGLGGGLKG